MKKVRIVALKSGVYSDVYVYTFEYPPIKSLESKILEYHPPPQNKF